MALFDFLRKSKPKSNTQPAPIRMGTNLPLHTIMALNSKTALSTPDQAMTIAAYYSCINLISNTIATMPRSWYYRDDSIIQKYSDYDQQRYIKQESSPGIVPFRAFRTWVANYLMGGNGYMALSRDAFFRPYMYTNRKWHEMMPIRDDDDYIWYYDKKTQTIQPYYNVLHLADLSDDELIGKSKVAQFAELLGGSYAAKNFVNKYFTNGLKLGAVVEYPTGIDIDDDTARALEESMNMIYGDIDKSGQVGVITEGGSLKQLKPDMPLGDAKFIEAEQLTREDIAMVFSVPLSMLEDKQSSYNTLEQTTTQYLEKAIVPILTHIEQEMNLKCLRPSERDNVYIKHDVNGILRADASTQSSVLERYVKNGLMSINEARRLLELTPVEGGDAILVQSNNMDTLTNVTSGANTDDEGVLEAELDNLETVLTAFVDGKIDLNTCINLVAMVEEISDKEAFDLIKETGLV